MRSSAAPGVVGDDRSFQLVALEARVDQVLRQDEVALVGRHQRVGEFRMHRQRLVGRNRPRRRRPDHVRAPVPPASCASPKAFASFASSAGSSVQPDVDRDVDAVLVLDFGLGQRALAVEAPVDGLQAAVQEALLQDSPERADLVGLVLERHRRVGMVPVAQHAQALEAFLLLHDLLIGIGAREPLRFRRRQVLAVRLLDLHLDRHAVAVPAGHVGRVEAGQLLALDDDVLEDLVDRMADVDVAIGVRRPVVQDEARAAARRGPNRLVHLALLPLLDPLRFALGEVAAHRERRVRQVQRGLVVGLGFVGHAVTR